MFRILLIYIFLVIGFSSAAQDNQYKVGCIAFYNLENLFDTLDNPEINDDDFLPSGSYRYNTFIYQQKLKNLSKVIMQIGTSVTPDGAALLGVSEVENRAVLEDLVAHPDLATRKYSIVHHDSPDERGIDVGLLYQPKYFKVIHSKALRVKLFEEGEAEDYTRDVLWVEGVFDGDTIHVFVNHWPSRSGGEAASSPLRQKAASVCREVIDSLKKADPLVKVIVMGDLNDDPTSTSVKDVLRAEGKVTRLLEGDLYNPWWDLYKKGVGTLAWGDAWNLFDQIIISQGLLKDEDGYSYYKCEVIKEPYMLQKSGRYKGYPLRTFAGSTYLGGYSDHFPTCIYLIRAL